MARPSNKIDTVSMTVAFPPQIKRYLEDLSLKGTFGGVTPQDVIVNAMDHIGREKVLGVVLNRVRFAGPRWLQKRLNQR